MQNHTSERDILARHRASLKGTLRACRHQSEALGLRKTYYVYEPPGYPSKQGLPILYLLRGHQREWVNIREDTSRRTSTAIEDLDYLIMHGEVPPLIAVMPGLNSNNNHVPSLGINMSGHWPTRHKGLGSGQFWTFLSEELIHRIEGRYPETEGGLRLVSGFSLGGYTASLLALRKPGYFDHVALYDGTLMWPKQHDPREQPPLHHDRVWCYHPIFDAALGPSPRSPRSLDAWNPTNGLVQASGALLKTLRQTTFWVASAHSDGYRGNLDRTRNFVEILKKKKIPTGFGKIIFSPRAAHNWHWNDRFLIAFLRGVFVPKHDVVPETAVAAEQG